MRRNKHIKALFSGLAILLLALPIAVSAETAREPDVKAAILYNLARFSTWEETNHFHKSNFTICTLFHPEDEYDESVGRAVETLSGRGIHNRVLHTKHLTRDSEVSTDCQVLYVSRSYMEQNGTSEDFDLRGISHKGILTISDFSSFLTMGGCMSIHRSRSKLRFSINQGAMRTAKIRPSSNILRLSVNTK